MKYLIIETITPGEDVFTSLIEIDAPPSWPHYLENRYIPTVSEAGPPTTITWSVYQWAAQVPCPLKTGANIHITDSLDPDIEGAEYWKEVITHEFSS